MESLRDFFVTIGLDSDAASFASAQVAVDLLEKGLQMLVNGAHKLKDVFVQSVMQTASFGEEMEVLSQKTGIGVESLQKLGYAASLSHSSAQEMGNALGHLAKQIESAKDGGAGAQENFKKLGISMADVRNKSPEELFLVLADKMKEMGAGSKRTALSMGLLGRAGKNLIPTLDRGADGLREMGIEAEQLNVVMSEDGIKAAAAFKENLEKLEKVGDGLRQMIAGPLIEALQPFLDQMLLWLKANRDLIKQTVERWVGRVAKVLVVLGRAVMFAVDHLDKLVLAAKLVAIAIGSTLVAALLWNISTVATAISWYVALGIASTIAAAKAAVAWLLAAAPIVLIAAALGLAALAAEDFFYFLTGGNSLLGHVVDTWGQDWTKFVDGFVKPRPGDWWLTSWLRAALAVVIDLEKHLGKLANLIPGVSTLKFFASRSVGEVGEFTPEMEQAQRIKTQMKMGGTTGGPSERVTTAAREDFRPWQAQPQFRVGGTVNSTINVTVPPGTPPPLVQQATEDAVYRALNGSLRDARAATGH